MYFLPYRLYNNTQNLTYLQNKCLLVTHFLPENDENKKKFVYLPCMYNLFVQKILTKSIYINLIDYGR